jgi:hypothetical protein
VPQHLHAWRQCGERHHWREASREQPRQQRRGAPAGSSAPKQVPSPGRLSTRRLPPTASIRSGRPRNPVHATAAGSKPWPSSTTSMRTRVGVAASWSGPVLGWTSSRMPRCTCSSCATRGGSCRCCCLGCLTASGRAERPLPTPPSAADPERWLPGGELSVPTRRG